MSFQEAIVCVILSHLSKLTRACQLLRDFNGVCKLIVLGRKSTRNATVVTRHLVASQNVVLSLIYRHLIRFLSSLLLVSQQLLLHSLLPVLLFLQAHLKLHRLFGLLPLLWLEHAVCRELRVQ